MPNSLCCCIQGALILQTRSSGVGVLQLWRASSASPSRRPGDGNSSHEVTNSEQRSRSDATQAEECKISVSEMGSKLSESSAEALYILCSSKSFDLLIRARHPCKNWFLICLEAFNIKLWCERFVEIIAAWILPHHVDSCSC